MQRRNVLKAMGAAVLASATASLHGERAKAAGWRTAFGLNGFASSSRKYNRVFPIWEVLDFAAQMGFDGIELHAAWPIRWKAAFSGLRRSQNRRSSLHGKSFGH